MKLGMDYEGDNLVFIVGCPRSGTTWAQRLLACHPSVHTGQESDLFDSYVGVQLQTWRKLLNRDLSGRSVGLGGYLRNEQFVAVLKRYMLDLLEYIVGDMAEGDIFLEKTPSHALYIPEILELLPQSRIVHVVRDPRDAVSSLLAASKTWGNYWAPKDVRAAAVMWVEHVLAVRNARASFPEGRFFEMRYEEMTAAPEASLEALTAFLKLEWSREGISEAVENNRFEKARKDGGTAIKVKGEFAALYGADSREPEGFFRKARPGGWVEDLSGEDARLVLMIAGELMESLGYSPAGPVEPAAPDISEIRRLLLESLESDPSDITALNRLAELEYAEGHRLSAMEFLKDVLILEPSNAPAVSLLSRIQLNGQ